MWSTFGQLPVKQAWRPLPKPDTDRGPPVQFALFVNGGQKIELFAARTKDIAYFAISHVWGKINWRPVKCIDGEILTSPQKAKFIEERLYNLVEDVPFWMDTITVNQRDSAEVISTVQAILAIFRDAGKTIAIREADGLYNCCRDAAAGFTDYREMTQKLLDHVGEKHSTHRFEESYLKRLWTLQEYLLSHTIQFAVCEEGNPVNDSNRNLLEDPYWYFEAAFRVNDALYSLAGAFTHVQNRETMQALVEFMRAYLTRGTVYRDKPPLRRLDEDVYSNRFLEFYVSSMRAATQPRDYIFVTMPQFPWYH